MLTLLETPQFATGQSDFGWRREGKVNRVAIRRAEQCGAQRTCAAVGGAGDGAGGRLR